METTDKTKGVYYTVRTSIAFIMTRRCQEELILELTFCRSYTFYWAFVLKALFENVKDRFLVPFVVSLKYLENVVCSMR